MAEDLGSTWDDIAHSLNDWGPPLKPGCEDLQSAGRSLARWHLSNPVDPARVFMCGVTPEIATMRWPFAINLTAMDQAESMVRVVWPGDVAGVRTACVGDWLRSGLPLRSQHVVIGDGGFGFFDYPDGQRKLLRALSELMCPNGLFVYRLFAQLPERERLGDVIDALHAGRVGNFHAFKWRVAMAMQRDSSTGVRLHDIWQAVMEARVDHAHLPQPGFSPRAVDTIRFYKDRDARLYFPTLEEFKGLLTEVFDEVEVHVKAYELGERCPTVTARRCSSR